MLIAIIVIIILVFISIYSNIPMYSKMDKKDIDKFLVTKGYNPKIKRVLYKMQGNSREISIDYPELISSPLHTNTDQLIVIDENRHFRNTIFKTDFSKERYKEINTLIDEYDKKFKSN